MHDNPLIAQVLADMSRFASKTKNDRLCVEVARAAARLQHAGGEFEKPLTRREHACIRPFLERAKQRMATVSE